MAQWRLEEPRSLDLAGVRRLHVRIVGGSADVVGRAPDATRTAHVEVSSVEAPLLVTLEDGTLTIAHERLTWSGLLDWGEGHDATASVSVVLAQDCPIELGVVSAEAGARGLTAGARVKSVSGNVTLADMRGEVDAQTVSGSIETRALDGSLHVRTVSGAVSVVGGSCARVQAETVNGDVLLDLDVPPATRIDLSSVSGDVTVRLPQSAGLSVAAKTLSGHLDSTFSAVHRESRPGGASLRGSLGDSSGRLRVTTVSGGVALLQRATV